MMERLVESSMKCRWLAILIFITGCTQTVDDNRREIDHNTENENVHETETVENRLSPRLELEIEANEENPVIALNYQASANHDRFRIADINLAISENLTLKTAKEGKSILEAQKRLIVQQNQPGKIRLVILAADNTHKVESGPLAILNFSKTDNKPAKVEILADKPIFAPEQANRGLTVGDPLTF